MAKVCSYNVVSIVHSRDCINGGVYTDDWSEIKIL